MYLGRIVELADGDDAVPRAAASRTRRRCCRRCRASIRKARRDRDHPAGRRPEPAVTAAGLPVPSALSGQGQTGGVFHRAPEAARPRRTAARPLVTSRSELDFRTDVVALRGARDAATTGRAARSSRGSRDRASSMLKRGRVSKTVDLVNGNPVSTASTPRDETLGHFLVNSGVITEEQHRAGGRRARPRSAASSARRSSRCGVLTSSS